MYAQMERDTTRQAHKSLQAAFEQLQAAATAERTTVARHVADLEAAGKLQSRMLADLELLQEEKKMAESRVAQLQASLATAQACLVLSVLEHMHVLRKPTICFMPLR